MRFRAFPSGIGFGVVLGIGSTQSRLYLPYQRPGQGRYLFHAMVVQGGDDDGRPLRNFQFKGLGLPAQ
jgi:hypothetical protein